MVLPCGDEGKERVGVYHNFWDGTFYYDSIIQTEKFLLSPKNTHFLQDTFRSIYLLILIIFFFCGELLS